MMVCFTGKIAPDSRTKKSHRRAGNVDIYQHAYFTAVCGLKFHIHRQNFALHRPQKQTPCNYILLLLRVISFVFSRTALNIQVTTMLKPDRKTTENTISVNWASPQGALIPSPELPQLHFVMQDNYHTFLLSLEDILLCLREAERQGEIPPVGDEWWVALQGKFDVLRQES
ncbi:hypothetical protein AB2909_14825 [Escherichia coli]